MAKLYITEFSGSGFNERSGLNPVALVPSLADQTITIAGVSAQSTTFANSTNLVRLVADAACNVKFGTNPNATTDTMYLAAGAVEYFGVATLVGLKVAVIAGA